MVPIELFSGSIINLATNDKTAYKNNEGKMIYWATTTIQRPMTNTERRNRLLMGIIGAHEPDIDGGELDDDFYEHAERETLTHRELI